MMETPGDRYRYRERARVQCLVWAQGRPYHEPVNDECCPDFSCCRPSLFMKDEAERWQHYHDRFGGKQ